jgi:hypothetical protein
MSSLVQLDAARRSYLAAVVNAVEALRRHEGEYVRLCKSLDAAQRDLRAAGYLRAPPVSAEPTLPPAKRLNRTIERAQLRLARELMRRRGGPSSGMAAGHPGHRAFGQGG